jgi:predicted nicotinamide N-methyase
LIEFDSTHKTQAKEHPSFVSYESTVPPRYHFREYNQLVINKGVGIILSFIVPSELMKSHSTPCRRDQTKIKNGIYQPLMPNRIRQCLILLCLAFLTTNLQVAAALSTPRPAISEIFSLHKVHLRGNNPSSPWCYAATIDPTREAPGVKYNFLATQVWPSARTASFLLERNADAIRDWKVCELGCGPALPSLVMADLGLPQVIATDLDQVALDMVQEAAREQAFENLITKCVDLTGEEQEDGYSAAIIEEIGADLYIMSDVFENASVARGAAGITMKALQSGAKVWTFAQSDRAQREIFLQELKELGADEYVDVMEWRNSDDFKVEQFCNHPLMLFDLDEITVNYG